MQSLTKKNKKSDIPDPKDISRQINEINYKIRKQNGKNKTQPPQSESWKSHPIFSSKADNPKPKKTQNRIKYIKATTKIQEHPAKTAQSFTEPPQIEQSQEVAQFLQQIGMEKYSSSLAAYNVTTLKSIHSLSATDYENIGIPLGHKLKIIKFIKQNIPQTPAEPTLLPRPIDDVLEKLPEPENPEIQQPILETKDLNIFNREMPENEDFLKARQDWLESNNTKGLENKKIVVDAPIIHSAPKESCWGCFKLICNEHASYDYALDKKFCSEECHNKYICENTIHCSYSKCSKSFVKVLGISKEGLWYCGNSCMEYAINNEKKVDVCIPDICVVPSQVFSEDDMKEISEGLMEL